MTQQEVIKKFMYSLDVKNLQGEAALDEAVKYCSNFTSIQEVIKKMIYDCKSANDADDFLKTYCGINLDNEDTGAITGFDAGGSVVKTAESVVSEDSLYQEFPYDSYSIDGLTVKLGDIYNSDSERMTATTYNELSDQQKYLWNSLYSYWLKSGLDLIAESYGNNFSFNEESSAVTKTMYISFSNQNNNWLASTWGGPTGAQKCIHDLQLDINLKYYSNASGENGSVTNGQEYLDRTIAHELTHAVMLANVDYFFRLPAFTKEGLAELTHGVDDTRSGIRKLAADSSLLEKALVMDTDTVKISGVSSPSYAGGYMFHRYLARQAGDLTINNTTSSTSVKTFYGNDIITNSGFNVSIDAGLGDDFIDNYAENVLFIHGGGLDTIQGFNENSTLKVSGEYTLATLSNGNAKVIDDTGEVIILGGANLSTLNIDGLQSSVGESITNSNNGVLVNGTNRNDTISNRGNYVTIDAFAGNDTIIHHGGSNVSILAGDGNDLVSISGGNYVTIDTGAGNDSIVQYDVSNVTILAGDGDDTILNSFDGDNVSIFGGAGNDSIENYGEDVTISGGDGDDKIINVVLGANVSVDAGDGADTIENSGEYVTIDAGTGNDFVSNLRSHVTIDAGDGADTIDNDSSLVSIFAGAGDDYIYNLGSHVTVDAGDGADTITAGDSDSINAGAGNDYIRNDRDNVTLSGGAGDDSITLGRTADNNLIEHTAGLDTISGFKADSTLKVNGEYTLETLSNDVKVIDDTGEVIILGGANLSSLNIDGLQSSGGQFIINYDSFVLVNGTSRDDTIYNNVNVVTISAGAGNDSIVNNFFGFNVSINAGDGDDTISNDSEYVTIAAGAGNDSISNSGENVTINAGAGDDQISLSGSHNLIEYTAGNDTILGFGSDDTLKIGNGTTDTYSMEFLSNGYLGNNVGLTTANGKILLKDAVISSRNILGREVGNDSWTLDGTTATYGSLVTVTGVKSLDGLSLNDKVVTVSASSLGTEKVTISDGYTLALGSDVNTPASVKASYANNVYTTAGKSAGYTLSGNVITYSAATTKEINFSGVAGDATTSNFYLSGKTLTVGKAAVKTDGTPVKILNDGYTLKLGKGMGASKTVKASYADNVYTTAGKTEGYTLASNKKSITYVDGTSKEIQFSGVADDATTSNFYLKGTTLTVGKDAVQTDGTPFELLTDGYTLKLGKGMNASKISEETFSDGVYTFGGQTAGYLLGDKSITYTQENDEILQLSGLDSKPNAPANKIMRLEAAEFSLNNLCVTSNDGGYIFSLAAGNYGDKTFTGSDEEEKILNAGTNLKILAGAGNDSVRCTGGRATINAGAGADTLAGSAEDDIFDGGSGKDILWGGKGDDSLLGGKGNDSINGGAGADTLWGGAGNDTLLGGTGSDTFIYRPNEGTDRITDFAENDLLQIMDGTFSDSKFSGSTLTLTIQGGGKVVFSGVSTDDTFNINGTSYSISNGKLK